MVRIRTFWGTNNACKQTGPLIFNANDQICQDLKEVRLNYSAMVKLLVFRRRFPSQLEIHFVNIADVVRTACTGDDDMDRFPGI